MKKLLLFFAWIPVLVQAQTAYSVCNAPGVMANYSSLQGAIDSVPAGSILYLFPSTVDYGNVILHKQLTIYGTGFMLDQNSGYYTAVNQYGVSVSSIDFEPGSDNSYVEGLQMIGLTPNPAAEFRFLLDSVTNITISRCLTDTWSSFNANTSFITNTTIGCVITGCYLYLNSLVFTNHSAGSFYQELGLGSQNLQFINNIIDSRGYPTSLYMAASHNNFGSMVFTNNTISCGVPGSTFGNAAFTNNFIINTNTASAFTAASVSMTGLAVNNITNTSNLFAPGSGNYVNADPDSIFVTSTFGYHSFDQTWQVLDSSFAMTYASDGGQVGAFGGANPYVLSGIPRLPNIYALTVQPDSVHRGNILVRIQGRASY